MVPAPPSTRANAKNIWVAASDGDLQRVQHLIENEALSPNVPDDYTYTPMHAAASYGHDELLEYLVSRGGDVNITDEDGDTPLYTVETIETARWLIEHGARYDHVNAEGLTPAQGLEEEYPEVASYLTSLASPHLQTTNTSTSGQGQSQTSEYHAAREAEGLTSTLLSSVNEVMMRAEAEGTDPDPELHALVAQTVVQGMMIGHGWADEQRESVIAESGAGADGAANKRPRIDEEEDGDGGGPNGAT